MRNQIIRVRGRVPFRFADQSIGVDVLGRTYSSETEFLKANKYITTQTSLQRTSGDRQKVYVVTVCTLYTRLHFQYEWRTSNRVRYIRGYVINGVRGNNV